MTKLDKLQELLDARAATTDVIFGDTLKGEMRAMSRTVDMYSSSDNRDWCEMCTINGCIILVSKPLRWFG